MLKQPISPSVHPQDLQQFVQTLTGELITPTHPAYDEARAVWNGMIDKYPAYVVRCTNPADVSAAVQFAAAHDLVLSVRGGGHNVAGHATNDGGLVIDLALINEVVVDPEARLVRAGGGTLIADLDRETQKYGLAVPMGVVSETGVAGLTLGGGFGHLRNKYGLSCDNLVEAEVVLADGRLVTASEHHNSDLFWGIRGGGGNFGIVTRFTYRAHPVGPDVFMTAVFHDGQRENMKTALRFYRDFSETAPDEISSLAVCGILPPADLFPKEVHHRPFVAFVALYAGDPAAGEQAMAPMRTLSEPLVDFSGVVPYTEAQTFFDEDYPAGELRYYWKSLNLTTLNEAAIERIVDHALRQPSHHSTTDLWHIGGAVTRIPEGAMAFTGRQASFLLSPEANWEEAADDDANIGWLRDFLADMSEFSDGTRYLNFPGFQEEGDQMMRDTFASKYGQLAELKRKYDPHNLFSLNQNIKPAQ